MIPPCGQQEWRVAAARPDPHQAHGQASPGPEHWACRSITSSARRSLSCSRSRWPLLPFLAAAPLPLRLMLVLLLLSGIALHGLVPTSARPPPPLVRALRVQSSASGVFGPFLPPGGRFFGIFGLRSACVRWVSQATKRVRDHACGQFCMGT